MLLIIAAVPIETALLRQQLTETETTNLAGHSLIFGKIGQHRVLLVHSGIGQTAMAITLTRLLENYPCSAVLLCGCGGSYPDSSLQIGDLALADSEIHGDLGVATKDSFIPLEKLNLPIDPLLPALRQSFTLDTSLLRQARQQLPGIICGPFVTINCCSGHPQLSEELQRRTGGICENMEGAAAAQVCADFTVPLLELRGISNPTGTRDPQFWDIKAGAEAAQSGLLQLLENWSPPEEQKCAN